MDNEDRGRIADATAKVTNPSFDKDANNSKTVTGWVVNNFKQNLKQVAERGENALDTERARLFRQYEALKQEIQTYENNLGFLNASSKKGSSLIDEMNRKVQKLKDDLNLVKEKIKAIDAENKTQQG